MNRSQMSSRTRMAAYAAVGLYSAAMFVYGITLPSALTRLLGSIPLMILIGFWSFDNFLWRVSPILGFVQRPLLNGTWHGKLVSRRRDENDKRIKSTREVVLVIRQNYTDLSLTQYTKQSTSWSAAAHIRARQKDDYQVQYQYSNEPKLEYRDNSPIHTGGSSIDVGGSRPQILEGEYWTARETRGRYSLKRVSDKHASSFEDGLRMVTEKEGG